MTDELPPDVPATGFGDMPPLPQILQIGPLEVCRADTVRAYGEACAAAATERAAKVADGYIGCDGLAAAIRGGD
jgi:hypothetical protein